MKWILIIMITLQTNLSEILGKINDQVIQSLSPGGELHDTTMRTVATTMLGEVRTRIHEKGLAADGADIGKYSTAPMYVSINANPGKSFGRPIGKTGKSKFASGKKAGQDHKSRYFPRGYDEYKSAIGRNQLGKVNLSLSGQMQSQFNVFATSEGYGLGWPDKEKYERAGHLEQKYRKLIWSLTDDERKLAVQVAQNVIRDALLE